MIRTRDYNCNVLLFERRLRYRYSTSQPRFARWQTPLLFFIVFARPDHNTFFTETDVEGKRQRCDLTTQTITSDRDFTLLSTILRRN